MSNLQPHIQCTPDDIADIVLLPGNPQRVAMIASYLDDVRKIAENREFVTITGKYQGTPLSVTSTGIGCPSTAIAVEELVKCGAKTLIRVGTCGSAWREDIKPLSVVIPTACVRDEGTTREYIPAGFPAVGDIDIIRALKKSAKEQNITAFSGINRTHDSFYAPDRSMVKWGEFYLDKRFSNTPSPIISSEMEVAALFVLATLLNVRAGAALAVDANPTPLKSMVKRREYLPNEAYNSKEVSLAAQKNMLMVALGAIKYLNTNIEE